MEGPIARFREVVIGAARDPGFVHHQWYVEYHLEIVERIALELCLLYPAADRDLVLVLVWLHDWGKIIGATDEYAETLVAGRQTLIATGFPTAFAGQAVGYAEILDAKRDLDRAPIEVQIVSSADGAAHLVGPFFALWWHEHPRKPVAELMAENRRKALVDWGRKIVLPEVRAAFAGRHRFLLEQCGDFPQTFLVTDEKPQRSRPPERGAG